MIRRSRRFTTVLVLSAITCAIAAVLLIQDENRVSGSPKVLLASSVTATQTVTDTVGTVDGNADPGDTLEYTVTITNGGPDAATGVALNTTLPAFNTLAGSPVIGPIAGNDTFASTGNIQISVPAGSGVLGNDFLGVNPQATVTSFSATSANGGTVSVSGDGSFTYLPPGNFTGTDTFTYTLSNSAASSTGTVTVNVSDRVVFVSTAGAGSTCRPATPCTLATADPLAAPPSGKDLIFILSGTYSSAAFSMNASQSVVGQGTSLAQALTDAAITLAANSVNPATAASSNPVLNNGGNIVTLNSNALVQFASRAVGSEHNSRDQRNAISSGTTTVRNVTITGTNSANGFNLTNNTGSTINFSSATIGTASGTGLIATGGGTITAGTASSINATSGQAVNANGVALNATFTSTSSGGGTNGIALTNVTGTQSFGTGTLTGASGSEFLVSGSNPTVTYSGNITQNNAGRVLDIQGTTGNSVTLSGTITGGASSLGVHIGDTSAANGNVTLSTLNLGTSGSRMTNQAVTITNGGSGATYSLGTVSVFTNGAQGIVATSFDGTLNSTAGTVNATNTGAVANLAAVRIDGPAGLTTLGMTLTSVSATSTANGINIQDTNGTFTITGDGASDPANTTRGRTTAKQGGGTVALGSGGVIQSCSSNGISLTATAGITLRNVTIQNNSGDGLNLSNVSALTLDNTLITGHPVRHGILGTSLNGLTMIHSDIGNNATTSGAVEGPDIWNIRLTEFTGNSSIQHSNIHHGHEFVFGFITSSGSLNLSVTNTDITDTGATAGGATCLSFGGSGSSSITLNVQNSTFARCRALAISASTQTGDAASLNVTVNASTFTNNGGGVTVAQGSSGTNTYSITNNNLQTNAVGSGQAININRLGSGSFSNFGLFSGVISGNTIGTAGVANSGSDTSSGIEVESNGSGGITRATIINNTIREVGLYGIYLGIVDTTIGGGPKPSLDVRVDNNSVANMKGTALDAVNVTPGALNTDTGNICLDIINNSGVGIRNGLRIRPSGLPQGAPTIQLEGWDGTTALSTYFTNRPNTFTGGTAAYFTDDGNGSFQAVANCTTPSPSAPVGVNGQPASPEETGSTSDPAMQQSLRQDLISYLALERDIRGLFLDRSVEEQIHSAIGFGVPEAEGIAGLDPTNSVESASDLSLDHSLISEIVSRITEAISPTVHSAPLAGEPVSTNATPFTMPANSTVVIKFRATVDPGPYPSALDNFTNASTISGTNFTNVQSTTASIALDASPDLSVSVSDSSTATQPGVTHTFQVGYSNATGAARQDASGVVLTTTLPANTTLNVAGSPGWNCVAANCTKTVAGPITANGLTTSVPFAVDIAPNYPAGAEPMLISTTVTAAETTGVHNNGTDPTTPNTSTDNNTLMLGVWTGDTSTDFSNAANWSNNTLPAFPQNISVPTPGGANAPTISTNVQVNGIVLARNLTIDQGGVLVVNNTLALGTNNVLVGTFTPATPTTPPLVGIVELAATTGQVTRTSGQINVTLRKNFSGGNMPVEANAPAPSDGPSTPTALFVFHVGTPGLYTPVTADVTGSGSLAVTAFDGAAPATPALTTAKTLQRYWQTNGSGLTANMLFNYGSAIENGVIGNYRTIHIDGTDAAQFLPNGAPCPGAGNPCVDTTANIISVAGVGTSPTFDKFWTAGESAAPTAAGVTVSGRVLTPAGRGVAGARVSITGINGIPQTIVTNNLGLYRFDDLDAGKVYAITVISSRYRFSPRQLVLNDAIGDLDFVAEL